MLLPKTCNNIIVFERDHCGTSNWARYYFQLRTLEIPPIQRTPQPAMIRPSYTTFHLTPPSISHHLPSHT
ncbi:hypothetical protein KBT16_15360, partial [Nostoc sp. CCCryo 231-06]|nr:hypothetical protein [Nostoc sp. CCCryo 231-06]